MTNTQLKATTLQNYATLPKELLENVILRLDNAALLAVASVSRDLYELARPTLAQHREAQLPVLLKALHSATSEVAQTYLHPKFKKTALQPRLAYKTAKKFFSSLNISWAMLYHIKHPQDFIWGLRIYLIYAKVCCQDEIFSARYSQEQTLGPQTYDEFKASIVRTQKRLQRIAAFPADKHALKLEDLRQIFDRATDAFDCLRPQHHDIASSAFRRMAKWTTAFGSSHAATE